MDSWIDSKASQTKNDSSQNIFFFWKWKPILIERDDGKESVNKIFFDFSKKYFVKRYNRYTSKRLIFVEHFVSTIKNLLKKPVFERGNAIWINETT